MRSAVLVLAIAAGGCLDPIAPEVGALAPTAPCVDSSPGVAVTFTADISPILRRSCDRCHLPGGDGFRMSGLDLSTYATMRAGGMRSGPNIIRAGEPCASVLWLKLGPAPPAGAQMPRGLPPLPLEERLLIHDWIAEGARDD